MGLMTSKDKRQYCKLVFLENGKVMVRRIYALDVQSAAGRIYTLADKALPEAIIVSSGEKKGSGSLGQILLNPKTSTYVAPETIFFPTARDLAMMASGIVIFHFFLALFDGLANAF